MGRDRRSDGKRQHHKGRLTAGGSELPTPPPRTQRGEPPRAPQDEAQREREHGEPDARAPARPPEAEERADEVALAAAAVSRGGRGEGVGHGGVPEEGVQQRRGREHRAGLARGRRPRGRVLARRAFLGGSSGGPDDVGRQGVVEFGDTRQVSSPVYSRRPRIEPRGSDKGRRRTDLRAGVPARGDLSGPRGW